MFLNRSKRKMINPPATTPSPRCCRCSRPKQSTADHLPKRTGAQFEMALRKQVGEVPPADHFKQEIFTEAARMGSHHRKRGAEVLDEEKENLAPAKFKYAVPPDHWVFQTPPNRKLNFRQMRGDQEGLRPAVLESRPDGRKVVHEVNTGARVNLSSFEGVKEVNIDKRFMMQVKEEQEMGDFINTSEFELERHFLSLTCRPKKSSSTLQPTRTGLRPKKDIFEGESGCSKDNQEQDSSGKEESFNLNFSNLFDGPENNTETFHFHF